MIVTVEWLKSREACSDQVALFEATFGGGVEVTKESLTRAHGLDLEWFGREIWGEVFDEAMDTAFKAYNEAVAPAFKGYEEAMALAWKAYNEVMGTAWKAYNEAVAPAFKVYIEAKDSAWKAYDEALIEVILNLSQVTSTP